MDTVGISRPLCKFAQWVDRPSRISLAVQEAFYAALTGRPGPVHLTIPMDVLRAEVPEPVGPRAKPQPTIYDCRAAADAGALKEAVKLIKKARRPMIIAGGGAFYADASQPLARLARLMRAPVAVPIWDRGAIGESTPEFVGVIGAASGEPKILPDADLVVLLEPQHVRQVRHAHPSDANVRHHEPLVRPQLLALDEPAADMNESETRSLRGLLETIRKDGTTILLIQHDMRLVMGVCDRMVVLDHGERIAEGAPAAVQRDPKVIEAYLGSAPKEAAA